MNVLAAERLTTLITEDEITRPIRESVAKRYPDSKATYLIGCRACVSVWAGLLVSSHRVPQTVRLGLALSSAVLLLDRQDSRIEALTSAKVRQIRSLVVDRGALPRTE